MKPRGFANLIIIIATLVALSAIASTYLVLENQKIKVIPEGRFCTMEAKQCSDGSYVGRTGPNCEFTPCPQDETATWKTYRNEQYGFEFKYPTNWVETSQLINNRSNPGFQVTVKNQVTNKDYVTIAVNQKYPNLPETGGILS